MPRSFLTPRLELLTGDGRFVKLSDTGAGWRAPRVLLARELCSFEWFEHPMARGVAGARAARLYARTTAPFVNPAILVRRAGAGYAIWWWDLDRVGPPLAERFGGAQAMVAPETLAQPAGRDWRIVRLDSGFEAQCWQGGELIASSWSRSPFDQEAWAAFTRRQRNAPPPPSTPPAPQSLPVSGPPDLGMDGWGETSPAQMAALGAAAAAAVLAIASVFWLGQGLRLGGLANTVEAQIRAERAATTEARRDDSAALHQLAAFQALSQGANPVAALDTALGVARLYHVTPKGFAIDGPALTLTLPYSALGQIEPITRELESSGVFAEVRPLTDSGQGVVMIHMSLKGAPPVSPAE